MIPSQAGESHVFLHGNVQAGRNHMRDHDRGAGPAGKHGPHSRNLGSSTGNGLWVGLRTRFAPVHSFPGRPVRPDHASGQGTIVSKATLQPAQSAWNVTHFRPRRFFDQLPRQRIVRPRCTPSTGLWPSFPARRDNQCGRIVLRQPTTGSRYTKKQRTDWPIPLLNLDVPGLIG